MSFCENSTTELKSLHRQSVTATQINHDYMEGKTKKQKNESCIFNEEIIHSTEIILAVTNAKERMWMSGYAVGSILEVPGRV